MRLRVCCKRACKVFIWFGSLCGYLIAQQHNGLQIVPRSELGVVATKTLGTRARDEMILSALNGGKEDSLRLALEEQTVPFVPSHIFVSIVAQNGVDIFLFPRYLYRSNNVYNQVRAVYWCKSYSVSMIEKCFWGNSILKNDPALRSRSLDWQKILKSNDQDLIISSANKQHRCIKDEIALLDKNAKNALMGSRESAKELWKYYLKMVERDPMNKLTNVDWIALAIIGFQGVPGARGMDDYCYWLQIAAENGDAESQWQLSEVLSGGDPGSEARRSFWLKSAYIAGYRSETK